MNILCLLKQFVKKVLAKWGYEVIRVSPNRVMVNSIKIIPDECRLYIGCGEDSKTGFIGCDIRPLSTVQLICAAWEVSNFTRSAKEIYSRHSLEHLTNSEARAALTDWHKALAVGGILHIIVPDIDFHIKQWLKADWDNSDDSNPKSDSNWGFAGLYGWQRECDPSKSDYNQTYWDVHKSGYNAARLKCLVEESGFKQIEVSTIEPCHLVVIATKLAQ